MIFAPKQCSLQKLGTRNMCMKNTMIPNEYECSACKTILSTKGVFFFSDRSANCTMNGKKKIKNLQTCPDCGNGVLLSKDVLRLHIQRVHGNEKSNVCVHFAKSYLLNNHNKQIQSWKTCEQCGKSVLNVFYLKLFYKISITYYDKHCEKNLPINKKGSITEFCEFWSTYS